MYLCMILRKEFTLNNGLKIPISPLADRYLLVYDSLEKLKKEEGEDAKWIKLEASNP